MNKNVLINIPDMFLGCLDFLSSDGRLSCIQLSVDIRLHDIFMVYQRKAAYSTSCQSFHYIRTRTTDSKNCNFCAAKAVHSSGSHQNLHARKCIIHVQTSL